MGQRDALSDLRRFGVYPRHNCAGWLKPDCPLPVLLSAINRSRDRLEGLGGDVVMGEHEEDSRGAESRPAQSGRAEERYFRRPYAVANITHGFITFLCAANAAEAYARVRVHDNDVMWHTTRIQEGQTHPHSASGHCMPKTFRIRKDGCYSAR